MPKVTLRPIHKNDLTFFSKWWNNQELRRFTSGVTRKLSKNEIKRYFAEMLAGKNAYHFIINFNGLLIGHISLVKRSNNWFETQIIIGERNYRNRGLGKEAIRLLLKKCRKIRARNIFLMVRKTNERAIRAYEKAGFQKIATVEDSKKYSPELIRMELKSSKFIP